MPGYLRMATALAAVWLMGTVSVQAQQIRQEDVILSVSGNTIRWAAVYKFLPERADDPYFHVRVFERSKGWEPWRYTQLAFHMAVTRRALDNSRTDQKAKTYNYKDVEILGAYRRWLEDASARETVPVCRTDILDCIRRLKR